ncbi:MAG TPA: HK97 gp10 family phage protein [Patescibacteria group bacterium]|nr:HK97 gp10 family phage protein [Patescibacteria group bacterium]
MEIELDLNDLNRVKGNFETRSANIIKAVNTILSKSIFTVQAQAKIYSPVRTGRMRASIGGGSFNGGSFQSGEGIEIYPTYATIGPTVTYAKYVERRTPFMHAAAEDSRNKIQQIVNDEVKKALDV